MYTKTLQEIKNTTEYVDVLRDQCMIKALYMHSLDEPIMLLTQWLEQNKGDAKKNAYCKLDLGDYLVLKNESYYKLDQIKKLLFYPSCRKKFILNYFADDEDLKKI